MSIAKADGIIISSGGTLLSAYYLTNSQRTLLSINKVASHYGYHQWLATKALVIGTFWAFGSVGMLVGLTAKVLGVDDWCGFAERICAISGRKHERIGTGEDLYDLSIRFTSSSSSSTSASVKE